MSNFTLPKNLAFARISACNNDVNSGIREEVAERGLAEFFDAFALKLDLDRQNSISILWRGRRVLTFVGRVLNKN